MDDYITGIKFKFLRGVLQYAKDPIWLRCSKENLMSIYDELFMPEVVLRKLESIHEGNMKCLSRSRADIPEETSILIDGMTREADDNTYSSNTETEGILPQNPSNWTIRQERGVPIDRDSFDCTQSKQCGSWHGAFGSLYSESDTSSSLLYNDIQTDISRPTDKYDGEPCTHDKELSHDVDTGDKRASQRDDIFPVAEKHRQSEGFENSLWSSKKKHLQEKDSVSQPEEELKDVSILAGEESAGGYFINDVKKGNAVKILTDSDENRREEAATASLDTESLDETFEIDVTKEHKADALNKQSQEEKSTNTSMTNRQNCDHRPRSAERSIDLDESEKPVTEANSKTTLRSVVSSIVSSEIESHSKTMETQNLPRRTEINGEGLTNMDTDTINNAKPISTDDENQNEGKPDERHLPTKANASARKDIPTNSNNNSNIRKRRRRKVQLKHILKSNVLKLQQEMTKTICLNTNESLIHTAERSIEEYARLSMTIRNEMHLSNEQGVGSNTNDTCVTCVADGNAARYVGQLREDDWSMSQLHYRHLAVTGCRDGDQRRQDNVMLTSRVDTAEPRPSLGHPHLDHMHGGSSASPVRPQIPNTGYLYPDDALTPRTRSWDRTSCENMNVDQAPPAVLATSPVPGEAGAVFAGFKHTALQVQQQCCATDSSCYTAYSDESESHQTTRNDASSRSCPPYDWQSNTRPDTTDIKSVFQVKPAPASQYHREYRCSSSRDTRTRGTALVEQPVLHYSNGRLREPAWAKSIEDSSALNYSQDPSAIDVTQQSYARESTSCVNPWPFYDWTYEGQGGVRNGLNYIAPENAPSPEGQHHFLSNNIDSPMIQKPNISSVSMPKPSIDTKRSSVMSEIKVRKQTDVSLLEYSTSVQKKAKDTNVVEEAIGTSEQPNPIHNSVLGGTDTNRHDLVASDRVTVSSKKEHAHKVDGNSIPQVSYSDENGTYFILCCNCDNPAVYLCSGCRSTVFCSRKCQTISWKTHKAHCLRKKRQMMKQ